MNRPGLPDLRADPAPKDRALRLDQEPGHEVCRHRGAGSDAGVLAGDQGWGNGETEFVQAARSGEVTHEMRATFAEDPPQSSKGKGVHRSCHVDAFLSLDDHIFLTQRAAGEVDRLSSCLSLIHISEPTRLGMISYAVFCLKK